MTSGVNEKRREIERKEDCIEVQKERMIERERERERKRKRD